MIHFSDKKRTIDLAMATTLLFLLSLPMLLIIGLIKATSRGPVLYWSDRIGRNNCVFRMPKFRTMVLNTPEVATDRLVDPHKYYTRIGKLLRKASFDELPQLFSVLQGHMSMVGPRPALHNQYELIRKRTGAGVNTLLPGITGWAQINGRDEISDERKVTYDRYYLENRSISFDLLIVARTFWNVLERRGIRH